jgi:Domain of unknown function (DUF6894)
VRAVKRVHAGTVPELPVRRGHCNTVPRYHFHIVDGVEVFDSLGAVLLDNEAARTRGVELASNLGKAHLADLTTRAIQVSNDKARFFLKCQFDAQFNRKF